MDILFGRSKRMTGLLVFFFPLRGLLCCYMVVVSSKAVDPLSVIDLDFPISSGAGNYLISSPDNV